MAPTVSIGHSDQLVFAAAPHLRHRRVQGPRQTLTADLGFERYAVPAAFDEFPVGIPEPFRRPHDAVFEHGALFVAAPVQRPDHLAGQSAGLVQHGVDQIAGRFLIAGQGGDAGQAGDMVEHKAHVVDGCAIVGHGSLGQILSVYRACDGI